MPDEHAPLHPRVLGCAAPAPRTPPTAPPPESEVVGGPQAHRQAELQVLLRHEQQVPIQGARQRHGGRQWCACAAPRGVPPSPTPTPQSRFRRGGAWRAGSGSSEGRAQSRTLTAGREELSLRRVLRRRPRAGVAGRRWVRGWRRGDRETGSPAPSRRGAPPLALRLSQTRSPEAVLKRPLLAQTSLTLQALGLTSLDHSLNISYTSCISAITC